MRRFVIDLLTSILIPVIALPILVLLWAMWRRWRRRGRMVGIDGEAFFEGSGMNVNRDLPDMRAGIFSVPTLDDAAGIDAIARDQADLRHKQELAVELMRRQRRAARWDWLPWSWRMSRLRVQIEEARAATQRQCERAEFYRQHVIDHTTPSVRACRAVDDAADGPVTIRTTWSRRQPGDGSDDPITADNWWRS